MSSSQHVYEIRARKDRRGIDLIGERLPLSALRFEGPDAIEDAVNYARSFSYPHPAIIRVLNESGMLAVTLELADDFSGNRKYFCASSSNLLDKFVKEPKTVQEQGATIALQQKQIEALTAGLQKVSAQLEVK